ncbi:MAG: hypothetical protein ABF590_02785, partial [Komagataeibacter saccharivorans]
MTESPAVLFVCTGNICRSPLAEGAFRHAARQAGLAVTVDSAGTGNWHAGAPPDRRGRPRAPPPRGVISGGGGGGGEGGGFSRVTPKKPRGAR